MIRSYSVALAISFIRVITIPLSVILVPRGFTTQNIFLLSLWSGWAIAVIAAEMWIRFRVRPERRRPAGRSAAVPAAYPREFQISKFE